MPRIQIEDRIAQISGPGRLYVASDLHGNLTDFRRLARWLDNDDDSALLFLGDLFHGPAATESQWARELDHLGDFYRDRSAALFRAALTLWTRFPGRVVSLMGNHEHAHVGGPMVSKFHRDEGDFFERQLDARERAELRRFIRAMPLIATTSCGVVMTHGAPPESPFDRASLAKLDMGGYGHVPLMKMWSSGFLGEILWRRASSAEGTERFLDHLRAAGVDAPCNVVVHGHEVVWEGWEVENPRLLNLSTSYGMRRARKTMLVLDLDREYATAEDLRPGVELKGLYG